MPGRCHSKKWKDCVDDVKAKGRAYDPYAVCTSVLNGEAVDESELEKALEAISSNSHGAVLRGRERTHKPKKLKRPKGPDPLKPKKPEKPKDPLFGGKQPKKPKKPEDPLKPHKPHKIRHGKKFKEMREQVFRVHEAQTDEDDRLFFPVTIIREGLGNLRDRNYYLPNAIKSGEQAYNGAKAYYDHPSEREEQEQPNRKVNELLGHYEKVQAVKGKDGLSELNARLYIIEGMSRAAAADLLKHAVIYTKKFPDKQFCGISINGDGEGETCEYDDFVEKYAPPPAALEKLKQIEGQSINAIGLLTEAFSADVVTAAGAGGQVKTQESKERRKMKFLEGFKKFWAAVEKDDFKTAEAAVKDMLNDEGKGKEKKEGKDKEDGSPGVKAMLQAMRNAEKNCEKKEGESEAEYEAKLEKALAAELEKQEKEKKEAEDKDKEAKDKEKKEGEDDDDSDDGDDKDKKPPKKKDGDDDDDDSDDTDEGKDKEKKEGESEDEDEDDDSDDDDDDGKGADDKDHPANKLLAKVMKKHLSMAKQMQAMNEKMEKMSAELEKHESETKQSKKESAAAKTQLEIKARDEMIDRKLSESRWPMRVTKLWRKALEGCRTEKEIDETIKELSEAASQASASRFFLETSSKGLSEKASEEQANNSDLFLSKSE